jgi:endonuclease YncB( thermonuclease family)
MRMCALLVVIVVATGCDGGTLGAGDEGRVVRVADGDTLTVRTGDESVQVRLLGIDAPESSTTRFGRTDCGGDAAERSLRAVAEGVRVRLVTDPDSGDTHDRYGRLLAYADGPEGDLGEAQLRAGHAVIYRYRERRFSRLDRYRRAQRTARARRRGAWGGCPGFHAPGS